MTDDELREAMARLRRERSEAGDLYRWIDAHPLYQTFGSPLCRTAADVAGFQLTLSAWTLTGYLRRSSHMEDEDRLGFAQLFVQSAPYLWHPSIWDVVPPLPEQLNGYTPEFPFPLMFFCFHKEFVLGITNDGQKNRDVWAVLLIRNEPNPWICTVTADDAEDGGFWLNGPDDIEPGSHWAALIGGRIAFLNSPYVTKDELRLDRGTRRRMQRSGVPDWEPVRQVILRRPLSQGRSDPEDSAEHTEWSCRWVVSGHYRRQWYPSSESHKTIWIPPYIKGPEDKPLRPTVYRVAR